MVNIVMAASRKVVTQSQCNVSSMTWDRDAEVLDHMLAHILDKDGIYADATNNFMAFVIQQGVDDVCLIVTMSEDNFKSIRCDIDFKKF